MSFKQRRTLIGLLSALLCTVMAVCGIYAMRQCALRAYAAEKFSVTPGASVRITENREDEGLRFQAEIPEEMYAAAVDGSGGAPVYREEGAYFGMIIVPENYVTDFKAQGETSDFIDYLNVEKGGKKIDLKFEDAGQIIVNDGGSRAIIGSVVNLYLHNYNLKYSATAYYYDGTEYTYSAAGEGRSMAFTASSLVNADLPGYDENGYNDILNGFVEKSIYAAAGVEETEARTFTYGSQSYNSFEELPEITLSYSLDKETAVIGPEDSLTLELTVSPSADLNVEWSSSDDTVALVDGQGTVTPVGAGLAVITARSGEYSAECTVTVAQEAEYTTEYYVREGNGSFSLYDSVNGSGPAGSIVSAEQKTIAGYSLSADYPASVTSGEITADGELTLKLYYEIDNVTVKSFANAAVPGDNAQYVSVIKQAMPEEYAGQTRENTYLLEATSATAVSGVQPGAWGTRITIPFDSNDIGKYIIFSIYYTEHTVGDPSCYGEAVAWGQLNGGTELSLLNLGYGDRYNADYTLSEDPETGKWYNFVFLLESSQFEGAAFDISFSNYVDTEAYMGDILVMDGETLYNYYGSDTYAVEHYVRQADGSYQLKEKQDGLPASYNAAVSAEPVEIEGCTYNAAVSVASGNIPAKDKFALKLYYEDNRFAFDGVNNIDLGVTEALPKFDGADAGKSALCNFGDKKIVGGEKAREGIYYVGTGDGTFGATAQHKFTIHQDYLGKYIVIGAFYENITISTPDTSIKGKVLAWTAEGVPISPLNVYDAETGAVPAVTGEYGKWYDHVLYLDPASYTAGQVIGLTFAYHQNVEMYISGVSVLSSEAAAALGFVK